jgi:hypothetical protein
MLNADSLLPRPKLVNATLLARTLDNLRPKSNSPAEMWKMLTDRYVVDLDTVAALLPTSEPDTHWLPARD